MEKKWEIKCYLRVKGCSEIDTLALGHVHPNPSGNAFGVRLDG